MDGWESFALAQAGAAATLAGLVLVGVSVNLALVLAEPSAPARIAEALVALLALLVTATVLLVPGQHLRLVGAELLCIGAADWATILVIHRRATRRWAIRHPPRTVQINTFRGAHVVLGQLATVPFVVAGVVLLLGSDDGLYGVALGAVGTFALVFLDAWLLLIEINRIGIER